MKQHLMGNILTISRCATMYREVQLKETGITGWQAPYIPQVVRSPGITQDELSRKLHVDRSNVARQLALLEEKGVVTRHRSEQDKRLVEVYPTEKAKELYPKVEAVFKKWRELLFYDMSEEERDLLEDVLERLARRAEDINR